MIAKFVFEKCIPFILLLLLLAVLWVICLGSWAIIRIARGACSNCLRMPTVEAGEEK